MNTPPFQWGDPACGQNVDREINRKRIRMEKIQRPQINRPACKVRAARRLGQNTSPAGWMFTSSHPVFLS